MFTRWLAARLLEELVLGPLGFENGETAGIAPRENHLSMGHRYWFVWPRLADLPVDPGRLATASLTASAADIASFLQFQLGDGTWREQALLSAAGLEEMQEGAAQGDGFTYGLGWRNVALAGSRTVQHGGVLPNYCGKMILLPDKDLAVVFVLPWAIGLSLRSIVAQTPDLALWLAVMSVMALCAATLRICRVSAKLRRTRS